MDEAGIYELGQLRGRCFLGTDTRERGSGGESHSTGHAETARNSKSDFKQNTMNKTEGGIVERQRGEDHIPLQRAVKGR